MAVTVKLEGFKELEKELAKLATPAARKASARRALKVAAQPMADAGQAKAPRGETGDLSASVAVGTKLSKRQAKAHRKMFRNDKAAVEIFVGPGPDPAAWNQEFGNRNHAAQPFMRPAFDQEAMPTLDRLGKELWSDISKSVARAERRAARLAAKGQ
jgi:HK97 gp10 family phage protein